MRYLPLLAGVALLVLALPLSAQSIERSFYTREEFFAALRYGIETGEQEAALALELHSSYFAGSMDDFTRSLQEHNDLTREWAAGVLSEASYREKVEPLCASYAARQAHRDRILLSDVHALWGAGPQEAQQFVSLLAQLRELRPDSEGGGHCHPLLAWSVAFGDAPLPVALHQVCEAYGNSIAGLLEQRHGMEQPHRGSSERAIALHSRRQMQIGEHIDDASDQCAEQFAAILGPADARHFLHTYYRLRAPRYFNTAVDMKLAAINADALDDAARDRLEEYRSRYWQRLRVLNGAVLRALRDSARSVGGSMQERNAARVSLTRARTEREEELKLLLAELDRILVAIGAAGSREGPP